LTFPESAVRPLDQHVIGRAASFFHDDLTAATGELEQLIADSRILIIGGAGSIGSRTLRTILQFRPAVVHVIDHNENGLAELVRDIRSSPGAVQPRELLTLPFDFGGDPFRLWMAAGSVDYDYVLSFAALKHVRTEKDPFSILAMLETNVVHVDGLARLFSERREPRRVFSVSTDKAANPSSMMGATKRIMEHALFAPTHPWGASTEVSSARFANVAFSNGSLLQSWENRLAARQPLACPDECRRFFVSLDESGHLCTLVAFLGSDRTVAVPALDPGEHLVLLSDVAARFLEFHGFEASFTHDADDALRSVDRLAARGTWPVLLTPLDTGGEKPYEEFVGSDETVRASRFSALREVDYLPPHDPQSYSRLVENVRAVLRSPDPSISTVDDLQQLIADVEPAFASSYRASSKSLDQRI
jgi:FlaA1/EpsC-like NDP-sugar epimerase